MATKEALRGAAGPVVVPSVVHLVAAVGLEAEGQGAGARVEEAMAMATGVER